MSSGDGPERSTERAREKHRESTREAGPPRMEEGWAYVVGVMVMQEKLGLRGWRKAGPPRRGEGLGLGSWLGLGLEQFFERRSVGLGLGLGLGLHRIDDVLCVVEPAHICRCTSAGHRVLLCRVRVRLRLRLRKEMLTLGLGLGLGLRRYARGCFLHGGDREGGGGGGGGGGYVLI